MKNINLTHYFLTFMLGGVVMLFICNSIYKREPQIIVNIPENAKQLSQMPTNTIIVSNEKAILWYSVYKSALDHNEISFYAYRAANQAVSQVYGDKLNSQ